MLLQLSGISHNNNIKAEILWQILKNLLATYCFQSQKLKESGDSQIRMLQSGVNFISCFAPYADFLHLAPNFCTSK